MIKILILFTLFFYLHSFKSYGFTHGVTYGYFGNVFYKARSDIEDINISKAKAYLCFLYLKEYYPNFKEKVFLEDYYNADPSLSYYKFEGDQWQFAEHNRPIKGLGLRIILPSEFKTEITLKFLDYGINNIKSLKQQKRKYYLTDILDRPDFLNIDSTILANLILSQPSEKIKATLNNKIYRNFDRKDPHLTSFYYFQNDKFYFYEIKKQDSVYLILDNIYNIVNEHYLGPIIFDSDSTFYFYNKNKKSLSQKLFIPKENFYYNSISSDLIKNRIYFEYRNYWGKRKIYILNLNPTILVAGFDDLEDKLIEEAIEKNKTR